MHTHYIAMTVLNYFYNIDPYLNTLIGCEQDKHYEMVHMYRIKMLIPSYI